MELACSLFYVYIKVHALFHTNIFMFVFNFIPPKVIVSATIIFHNFTNYLWYLTV
jgi:hypothetical protein